MNKEKTNLYHRYDNDRLEQYTRRDNLRIFDTEEDQDEDEYVLQAKVLEVAADVEVKLETDDISIAHRVGRTENRNRPVTVRFCHMKKRDAVLNNRKKVEEKQQ